MENSKNIIQLKDLVFPVFRLSERRPDIIDQVILYKSEYADIDSAEETANYRVVDDKSIDKPTLGLRRLALIGKTKIYPIGSAIYFLMDIIKIAKPNTWFIDSEGRLFQHKKSYRAKLQTFKIKQVLPAEGIGCVIELENIPQRFKSMRMPETYELYAGVLTYNHGYMLYGYYEQPIKTTWRSV